ncbi:MAG: glycosyltransferase, partial [Streptomycetales bacterium]
MRVTLLTIGFRGDVEPVVALGGALTHRGHEVGVAAAPEFEAMVRGAGLDFSPVGPPAAELLGDGAGQRLISGAGGVCGQARQMGRLIDEWAGRLADDALTAVEGSDALLFTPAANVGRVAEALGIPSMMISLWPKSRTGEFPAIGFPDLGVLGAGYNRLTHVLLEQLAWRPLQRAGNRIRTRLGLPPLRWQTPLGRDHREGRPVLYGFSEHVLPRPPDWRAWLHVCGYWFLDPPEGWRPPSDVTSFLEAGEPPVAIT